MCKAYNGRVVQQWLTETLLGLGEDLSVKDDRTPMVTLAMYLVCQLFVAQGMYYLFNLYTMQPVFLFHCMHIFQAHIIAHRGRDVMIDHYYNLYYSSIDRRLNPPKPKSLDPWTRWPYVVGECGYP